MPDLRDINAIVAGYVLVPNPSRNCKAQSLAPLDQFHLDEIAVCPISLPLPLDSQMDAVPSFLEGFNGRAVRNVDHADIVHVGDDVVHLQPTIDGSSTAINDLSYVYGGVVGDVRVVSSSCDRKAKTGIASLKRDVIIFPWLLIKDAVAFWIVGMIKNTWFAAADTERGIGVIGGGADDPVVAAGAALGSESLVRAATATAKSWV